MAEIVVFSKEWCPYCAKAKALLRSKGLAFTDVDVTHDEKLQREMVERSQRRSVPQLFIDGESIGGQVGTTTAVDNNVGIGHISGPDLGRELCARAVLIATGAQKRHLGIPGEKELAGKGVVYCSTCNGPLFKDLRIAIVGGGNSALEAAIEMAGVASHVHLVARGEWHADAILQDKVTSSPNIEVLRGYEPIEIHGTDSVTGLTVRYADDDATKRRLDVDGVFIEVGSTRTPTSPAGTRSRRTTSRSSSRSVPAPAPPWPPPST